MALSMVIIIKIAFFATAIMNAKVENIVSLILTIKLNAKPISAGLQPGISGVG